MKTPQALPTGSRGAPYDTVANRQALWVQGPAVAGFRCGTVAMISRGGSKGAGFWCQRFWRSV
jgi:hypothetical protein